MDQILKFDLGFIEAVKTTCGRPFVTGQMLEISRFLHLQPIYQAKRETIEKKFGEGYGVGMTDLIECKVVELEMSTPFTSAGDYFSLTEAFLDELETQNKQLPDADTTLLKMLRLDFRRGWAGRCEAAQYVLWLELQHGMATAAQFEEEFPGMAADRRDELGLLIDANIVEVLFEDEMRSYSLDSEWMRTLNLARHEERLRLDLLLKNQIVYTAVNHFVAPGIGSETAHPEAAQILNFLAAHLHDGVTLAELNEELRDRLTYPKLDKTTPTVLMTLLNHDVIMQTTSFKLSAELHLLIQQAYLDILQPYRPIGKSAFEVAQEAGFEGTKEEWLKSLKGPVRMDGVWTPEDKNEVIVVKILYRGREFSLPEMRVIYDTLKVMKTAYDGMRAGSFNGNDLGKDLTVSYNGVNYTYDMVCESLGRIEAMRLFS